MVAFLKGRWSILTSGTSRFWLNVSYPISGSAPKLKGFLILTKYIIFEWVTWFYSGKCTFIKNKSWFPSGAPNRSKSVPQYLINISRNSTVGNCLHNKLAVSVPSTWLISSTNWTKWVIYCFIARSLLRPVRYGSISR